LLYFLKFIVVVVGIIEIGKYNLLQYKSTKYLLFILIILIKIKLTLIKISSKLPLVIYTR